MTRTLLAILSLPLAFVVGCGDPSECTSEDCTGNTDCVGADCGDDDDTATPGEFSATLRSVAPYGWVGDHSIEMIEPEEEDILSCAASASCEASLVDVGNFEIRISGTTFECVPQVQLVDVNDDGLTVAVSDAFLAEGICFLTPEGEYSGMNVWTTVDDENGLDQGWIGIESWAAVISGDTFFFEGEDYLLEGSISDDLSSISYYLGAPGTSGGDQDTINLKD